jgi:hypothetical protein
VPVCERHNPEGKDNTNNQKCETENMREGYHTRPHKEKHFEAPMLGGG